MLTDDSPMPYGKYKDEKMEDVPAWYLLWLHDNDRASKSVEEYIQNNWDVLEKQAKENPRK